MSTSMTCLPPYLLRRPAQGIMAGKNLYELIVNENIELKKLSLWFCSIYMAVNTKKMKLIIFHSKGKIWHNIWQQWSVPALYSNPNLLAILDSIHFNQYDDSSRSYKLLLSFLFYEHLKKNFWGGGASTHGKKRDYIFRLACLYGLETPFKKWKIADLLSVMSKTAVHRLLVHLFLKEKSYFKGHCHEINQLLFILVSWE